MKIGIIGSGYVGATAAYAMVMRGVGREVILVDKNLSKAKAEADDILHAVPFAHSLNVRAGDYPDLKGSRVVIITAGVAQKPGESRLQLLEKNANILSRIIPEVIEQAPDSVLVITTNPVDVMTHLAANLASKYSIPKNKVIGSGTTLDTARFRALLGLELGIDPAHIHAYVIGEHGDSEVLNWSSVSVGGIPLKQFCIQHKINILEDKRNQIDDQVRRAAYHIIEGKGATHYGIGSALSRITDVILRDLRSIMTVCSPMDEIAGVKDVTVSLPHLVGGNGIVDTFQPLLDEQEYKSLNRSASIIRHALDSIEHKNEDSGT